MPNRQEDRNGGAQELPVELRRPLLEMLAAAEGKALAVITDELTLAARGEYTVGGTDALRTGAGLRAFNEVLTVVAAQLGRAANTGARGYPLEAFVDVIWEKAVQGEIHEAVSYALKRTLARVARGPD